MIWNCYGGIRLLSHILYVSIKTLFLLWSEGNVDISLFISCLWSNISSKIQSGHYLVSQCTVFLRNINKMSGKKTEICKLVPSYWYHGTRGRNITYRSYKSVAKIASCRSEGKPRSTSQISLEIVSGSVLTSFSAHVLRWNQLEKLTLCIHLSPHLCGGAEDMSCKCKCSLLFQCPVLSILI